MTTITEDITTEEVTVVATSSVNGADVDGAVTDAAVTEEAETPVSDTALIKIVKGSPTDVEIAALVSVLAAASGGSAPAESLPTETWGDPTQFHRTRAPFSPYSYLNPFGRRT
ncbi:acyl-CoA carboxylase epsilon subunit [Rhodococcus sp. NPDC056743]|uniref:acyl-CoA carboxylase epsilon subunit n=1 Tax=Rhodococcus sp. NPDC056743 TaxID=3345934 RepID=UPI003671AA1D